MAGRSGSAAIVVALVEAAEAFDPLRLAERIRDYAESSLIPDAALVADAFVNACNLKPKPERGDEEAVLLFSGPAGDRPSRKVDLCEFMPGCGCGVEAMLQLQEDASLLLCSVTFYLE